MPVQGRVVNGWILGVVGSVKWFLCGGEVGGMLSNRISESGGRWFFSSDIVVKGGLGVVAVGEGVLGD